ncbi:MAG: hypothetical protein JSS63_06010 [Bacteroidetes bacterium]|nr:hypothetical protein [Bacteroidota bacterium]
MEIEKKIIFCEYIDSKNTPINPRKSFALGPAGVNVKFFISDCERVRSSGKKFLYEISKVNKDFSEEYQDAIFTELNSLQRAHADFTFFKAGKFKVKVFDSKKKNLLKSGTILIKNIQK